MFGRPPRESPCECERSSAVSLAQTLNLINGPTIADAIAAPGGKITQLAESDAEDAAIIDEIFLSILSREPNETEASGSHVADWARRRGLSR